MQITLPVIAVNGVIGAQVSPLDRGFSYGDGVFETCALKNATIALWDLHCKRLTASCEKLFIPVDVLVIKKQLDTLVQSISRESLVTAVVKITVTRGQGGRGYRLPDVVEPTIVIGIFPAMDYPENYFSQGVTVRVCEQRLSCNSGLAGIKHLNRLEQILARAEWQDEKIAEGLLLNTKGNLIEAVSSNIFIVKAGELFTPDLSESGVAGVMRRFILEEVAPQQKIKTTIKNLTLSDVFAADEVFLCNSVYGIWPVRKVISEKEHEFKVGNITQLLQKYVVKRY